MKLRTYNEDDAKTIIKWINNERELKLWSADRYGTFPITATDINNNYHECIKTSNFYPMTLEDDGEIIGHLILRNPDNKLDTIRLGFIIVDPSKRGMGYGKKLINEAISYAKNELNAKEINLGVFANNKNAYNCYKHAGFVDVNIEKNAFIYHDESWDCIEMVLK